jgi:hypothetical protein
MTGIRRTRQATSIVAYLNLASTCPMKNCLGATFTTVGPEMLTAVEAALTETTGTAIEVPAAALTVTIMRAMFADIDASESRTASMIPHERS